jgi:hypothetical protein
MIRSCLLASLLAALCLPCPARAAGAARPSPAAGTWASAGLAYSDLHGATCQTVDTSARFGSRLCRGPAGYALMVYDSDAGASIDIVTPANALYPLSYPDVVTPGYATLGRKAE